MTESKKKAKKSDTQIQKAEKSGVELRYLDQNQALILTALLLHPTDSKAMESLGWGHDKFYRLKKQVEPLKEEFAAKAHQDTLYALSLAGKHAISKYVELLSRGGQDFQKGVAADILDRVGIIKQTPEQLPAGPVVQNIIAQKWDKYGAE